MKYVLSLIFVLTSLWLPAQTTVDNVGLPVVGSTTLSKNDQWHNLRRWVALTFDNSGVIDMQDEDRGTMVIKWSCPVKTNSEFVSAVILSTYVIDVRDGKYRLQRLNPRVSYQFSRPDIYDGYDAERSSAASADIKLISRIANRFFENSLEWPVGEQLNEISQAYLERLSATEQYRSDRDRDKGKTSDEWKRSERDWQLVHAPLNTFLQLDSGMVKSLNEALTINDDF